MPILSFCDLDGTFVQTARHIQDEDVAIVYTSEQGKDIVITNKQLQLYQALLDSGTVIPVTARSLLSMNRMKPVLTFPAHKICEHGVFIYDENDDLIKEYSDSLIKYVYSHQNNLKIALDKLGRMSIHNNSFDGIQFKPIYHGTYLMSIEGKSSSDLHSRVIAQYVGNLDGLIVSTNGRSFSITCAVPSYKQVACQYLMDHYTQYQNCVTLGFGDSISDIPFLRTCDFSVVPNMGSTQIKLGD